MIPFQNSLGFGYKGEKFLVFFGNKRGVLENINKTFSNLSFKKLKQTHSDIVLQASSELREGDSHYSSSPNEALIIFTADCIPLMIYCQQTHRVAAVHAGWKGVENQIVKKTLQTLVDSGSTLKQFQFFVGPSISQKSFEIDVDVYARLKKVAFSLSESDFSFTIKNKYYVDLNKILLSQIQNTLNNPPLMTLCNINTKTNLDFYSYRREKHLPERNLSFISLLV